jgi:hypothetical protein
MHELIHEFTNRKVSPWGGIKYLQQTYVKSGMKEVLGTLDLPKPGSNRGLDPVEIVEGFITSVVLGAQRINHVDWLRADQVIKEIFGWKKDMASASTLSRFFKKFDLERNDRVFVELMREWFSRIATPERMTLDIDSTVVTRYGNQEMASVGYNPQKQGRNSHHPILAFAAETKMIVNAWMRSGDSGDALQVDEFIDETFRIVDRSRIGLVRMDSGFFSDKIMRQLEGKEGEEKVDYIIRGRMNSRICEGILAIKRWLPNSSVMPGASYAEFTYQGLRWHKARRVVVVRTPVNDNPSGQANLFEEADLLDKYEYKVFVTSLKLSAVQIHLLYNHRADCENRIKELKYDYGVNGFALQSFGAMEAVFRFVMFAYNLMALFKQMVMCGPGGKRLSTVRFQCIAIGSYLVKNGRNTRLKLSAEGKRRHFLEHFFSNLECLSPPFHFSNA